MRSLVIVFVLATFLLSCRKEENRPQGASINSITGTWAFRYTDVNGSLSVGTLTVVESGRFQRSWVTTASGGSYSNATEGTFDLDGEVLVEEITAHSNTNARLPYIFRSRVVYLDERELRVKIEEPGSHTNVVVYIKEEK